MTNHDHLLAACFTEFYQELARIKLAIRDGRLPALLKSSAGNNADLAAATASRLVALLARQDKRMADEANQMERKSYTLARYFMAALADEVLGLNLKWAGREHWDDVLIERKLFGRSVAGRDFYQLCDRVLGSRGRNNLMEDLAGIALLCLQLGFQGQYRGDSGKAQRERYRKRLLDYIGINHDDPSDARTLFDAAYQGLVATPGDNRLAPATRWYRIGGAMLAVYLLLSTLVWVHGVRQLAPELPYQGVFSTFAPSR
ncbi:MAG: DotU family type IV/VI secretion system protein [Gammaproteobacteria bacterium]